MQLFGGYQGAMPPPQRFRRSVREVSWLLVDPVRPSNQVKRGLELMEDYKPSLYLLKGKSAP